MDFRRIPLILMIALVPAPAREPRPEAAVKAFVQAFYRWYAPIAASSDPGPSARVTVERRPDCFSPALRRALEADFAAQRQAKGEMVGLDFDPLLNSQDPGRFVFIRRIEARGHEYWVHAANHYGGRKDQGSRFVAVVAHLKGHWVFTNFRYGPGRDLVAILERLKADRKGPPAGAGSPAAPR